MVSKETLQQACDRIEPILKSDITWAIFEGPGWDPQYGASISAGKKAFVPSDSGCGVCAIGSHVIRNCQTFVNDPNVLEFADGLNKNDVKAAATSLKMGYDEMEDLYLAVITEDGEQDELLDEGNGYPEEIWELSRSLRAHATAEELRKAQNV